MKNLLLKIVLFFILNNEIITIPYEQIINPTNPLLSILNISKMNSNFDLKPCQDIKDCYNCSFTFFEYVYCQWNQISKTCNPIYNSRSYSYSYDLRNIFSQCQYDPKSNYAKSNFCNEEELITDENNNTVNSIHSPKIGNKYSLPNLLCLYTIENTQNRENSMFTLNITKNYKYINIAIIYNYGLYTRYTVVSNDKDYEINMVGVKQIKIFVHTPENYFDNPFTINYQFILFKQSSLYKVSLYTLIGVGLFIFLFFLFVFIVLYRKMKVDPKQNKLNSIQNFIFFSPTQYVEHMNESNKECYMCNLRFQNSTNVTILNCNHIFHYQCLVRWVVKNKLSKNTFFCPNCQRQLIEDFNQRNEI